MTLLAWRERVPGAIGRSPGDRSQDADCADRGIVMHRANADFWMEMMQIVAEDSWPITVAKLLMPHGAILAPPARFCSIGHLSAGFS
jgi:hypothetical protein